MNYKNGKIYKIICNITGKQYIGSTIQTLGQRLSKHRREHAQRLLNPSEHIGTSSFEIFGNGDYNIILIQDYPCQRREQLLMKERFFIDNMTCINKICPIRTREEILEYYRIKNRSLPEQVKRSTVHVCECGSSYTLNHKARHLRSGKHVTFTGIQPIPIVVQKRSLKRDVYTCECGSTLTRACKIRHDTTKKHLKFLEQ
tara:strand:- start:262 stop:861 length:600 start_codon:yes stop_codon:yes gene_type:complete